MPKNTKIVKQSTVELTPETSDSEIEVIVPSKKKTTVKQEPVEPVEPVIEPVETEPVVVEKTTPMDNIEQRINELLMQVEEFEKTIKGMKGSLKDVLGMCKKGSKKKITRVEKVKSIDKPLATFLGMKEGEHITKSEVIRKVSQYVKDNNLQYEDEKGHKNNFNIDAKLKKLFDTTEKTCSFITIQKHITPHLKDIEE
jgi:chromatin remodeling complex protein RSC6